MKSVLFALIVFASTLMGAAVASAEEQAEQAAIAAAAKDAFLASRFAELDRMADQFRNGHEVTESGLPKLTFYYDTLASLTTLYGAFDAIALDKAFVQIEAWLKSNPNSKSANILHARNLVSRAWLARGEGFAPRIGDRRWKELNAFVSQTSRELDRIRSFASDDPEWHATYLEAAMMAGWPEGSLAPMVEDALTVDAQYARSLATILNRRLPQWGGDANDIEAEVEKIVAHAPSDLGQAMYARAYAWLTYRQFRFRLFDRTLAKWPRMKQGFEDLTARYPSDWNFNMFALHACIAGDWDTLKSILARLDNRFIDDRWIAASGRARCIQSLKNAEREAEDAEHYSEPQPVAEEMKERFRIEDEATAALLAGRFEEIEATRAGYLATRARTASGAWKLTSYSEGLTSFRRLASGADDDAANRIRARIKQWKSAYPQSIAATIATARLSLVDAKVVLWRNSKIEPGKGVSTVAQLVEAARIELEAARVAGERDPVWWSTRLILASWDVISDDAFGSLSKEALDAAPDYDELRVQVLAHPKVSSKTFVQDYGKLIDLVLAAVQPDARDEAYADGYLRFGERWGGDAIVTQLNVDWPRMRRGLDTLTKRWPSDWNLNAYARFACMAQDKQAATELLTRIGDRIVEIRWTDWRRPRDCRRWAQAG